MLLPVAGDCRGRRALLSRPLGIDIETQPNRPNRATCVYRIWLTTQVELLSGPNRCSLEACAPLLAASGPSFVEALLCLHRGRGLHEDALALATEDRQALAFYFVAISAASVYRDSPQRIK